MKYEYQDLIIKTLLEKESEYNIDIVTVEKGEIIIGQVMNGICNFQEKDADTLHLTVTYGSITDICDKEGSELGIDFTIYDFGYPIDLKNQIVCYINIE